MSGVAQDVLSNLREQTHPTGWRRYVYSTNHKDIGTMYFVFAMCAGLVGGILSVMIRAELQEPGLQILTNTHTYNVFVTGHGLIMIFFTLMPALMGGFGNWFVPLLIGAPLLANLCRRQSCFFPDAFSRHVGNAATYRRLPRRLRGHEPAFIDWSLHFRCWANRFLYRPRSRIHAQACGSE
jgi:hypothetical protein